METCKLLQEETVSSIENWTDIVPEADIKTQVGVISELGQNLSQREAELAALKEELGEAKDNSEAERRALRNQVLEKEAQIVSLQRQIERKTIDLGGIGSTITGERSGLGLGIGLTSGLKVGETQAIRSGSLGLRGLLGGEDRQE